MGAPVGRALPKLPFGFLITAILMQAECTSHVNRTYELLVHFAGGVGVKKRK